MQEEIKGHHRWRSISAALFAVVIVLAGSGSMASAANITQVIPVGRAAGIKMSADGVIVARLSAVQTAQGEMQPARDAGLQEGDLISKVNGRVITTNEGLQEAVAAAGGGAVALDVVRLQEELQLTVTPAQDTSGKYRIGAMVRDSMAGIGTITFVDPVSGAYGSLGHAISDTDTGTLMPLGSGSIMEASVSDVKTGQAGEPGELHGEFNLQKDIGTITENTDVGVFGNMASDEYYRGLSTVPVGTRGEVEVGQAEILSNVEGKQTGTYTVNITKVFDDGDELGRCMMIEVTDPTLLDKTGGIVQGMSGSPLMQNGKIIGAVTHVLVNDPTKGYAVFIEKMLDEMES